LKWLRKTQSNEEFRADAWECAEEDVAYFVDNFCWTYDPRQVAPYIPFVLFERQKEYLYWLAERYEKREDGIAEKCRDVGFTWLNCAFLVHGLLFREGFKGTVGSRKVDLVDKLGDPDSIFEKMRFILEFLPEWEDLAFPKIETNHLKLLNRDLGATITGEGGDNMGRGGRSAIYLIDEAAHVERQKKVDAAVSANSDCKIKVSTPNGMGNAFYEQRSSGIFPVFTFNWYDDPRKDQAWYEKMERELDPVIFAQEVNIDYSASTPGIVIPAKYVMAGIGFKDDVPEGINPMLGGVRIAGLDVADEGSNKNALVIRQGAKVVYVESWASDNTTQTALRAIDICKKWEVHHINFDAIGVGAGVGAVFKENYPDNKIEAELRGRFEAQWSGNSNGTWKAVNIGASPTKSYWASERRTSVDKFANLKAELWWRVRERLRKSYDVVHGDYTFPLDECLSLPKHDDLKRQLSLCVYKFNGKGQLQIESKADMIKRGVISPDIADALILTEYSGFAYMPGQQTTKFGR